ncbi:MAG: iron ABC transporter permease [Candidatus Omnitrophica bacterium]|nr:iron ABC transporter permease [Candidatus Omnitrophota bacterium]
MTRISWFLKRIPAHLTAFVMAVPLLFIFLSMCKISGPQWTRLWHAELPGLISNSFLLVLVVTFVSLFLGSILAWLVEKTDLAGRAWMRPLLAAPLVIPCYIVAVSYVGFLSMNHWRVFYGFWGAASLLVLGAYPYVYLLVWASLRRLDPALSEAARCMGAGPLRRMLKVGLPLLAPSFVAGAVLAAIYVLSDFGVVTLMRYRTFVSAIYGEISGRYHFEGAAGLSFVLILFTFAFLSVQDIYAGRRYESQGGVRVTARPVSLGVFQIPAFLFVCAVLGVSLVIPVGVLVKWFIDSLTAEGVARLWSFSLGEVLGAGLKSLLVSSFAATAAVILALPLAYWTVREPRSGWGRLISSLSQSGLALPGVLIALGLGLFLAKGAPQLHFSAVSMAAAFLIHFFGQAYQSVETGLKRVSIPLEESARLLGLTPLAAFWRVTRPILRPSLVAGWLLVFLNSMRELPSALILRPAGFDTLTVKVWTAASEGFYAQAAAPALALVLVSSPLLWIVFHEGEGRTPAN